MGERRRSWLWVLLAIVGIGIYIFLTRPDSMLDPDEVSGGADLNLRPAETPKESRPSPRNEDALAPVTGIADDAAEALKRMNEDAQR